jgi:Domain of unknown function (DUF1996)
MTLRLLSSGVRAHGLLSSLALLVLVAACSSSGADVRAVASTWKGTRYPTAAFVVSCERSHEAADDPLVFPGQPSMSHLHSFFGNRLTSSAADEVTVTKMRSGATSCNDVADKAAYWTPSPAAENMRAYYDVGAADIASVEPYPLGIIGVSGDPAFTEPGEEIVGFRCGAAADGPEAGDWDAWPPERCGNGVALVRYSFGQCADDSETKLVQCKENVDARFPRLRMVMEFKGLAKHSGKVLGAHADFWNLWDPERLARLVAVCNRGERESNTELKECGLPGGQ